MSATVSSLLDLEAATLRELAATSVAGPRGRPLAGRVVAVLPFAPAPLVPAAWIATAERLGATALRLADFDPGSGTPPFAMCAEAARWSDILVTSHAADGFARAVAARTGRPVVNAGEPGEDPARGLALLSAVLRIHAADPAAAVRPPHVAVCGDLRGSTSARSLLVALAAVEAGVLLVPAPGRDLPEDDILRLARRTRRRPLHFEARTTRSLLDMVDTVLLSPQTAPQLPLFREVGVPPGDAERRARREVEDTDALFVTSASGATERLVATPFRSRGRTVPEGREEATGAGAVGALLAFAAGAGAERDASGLLLRYRSHDGMRCDAPACVGRRHPDEAPPDFAVVAGPDTTLECLYCGTRALARWSGSREARRYHPVGSVDARRILDRNLVLFATASDAEYAGYEAGRRRTAAGQD